MSGSTADARVVSGIAVAGVESPARELEPLEAAALSAWDEFARSPMQEWRWAEAWLAAFGAQYEPRMLFASGEGGGAILPLVRGRGLRGRLELVGAAKLWEPTDVLGSDPDAVEELARTTAAWRLPLLLRRIPVESPLVPAFRRAFGRGAFILEREGPGAPYVPLDPGWRSPELRLSAGRRSDFRRAHRRAEQAGPVSAELLEPAPAEVSDLLDAAFRIEAAGWKGSRKTALVHDAPRAVFFRHYALAAAEAGTLRLSFLRIGDRVAAFQLAVESHDRFWLLKIGYDEEFARCSPGTLLMRESIRWAADRGLAAYELLGSPEPWTRTWTRLEHRCLSLRIYPAGGRGLACLAADAAARVRLRLGRGGR